MGNFFLIFVLSLIFPSLVSAATLVVPANYQTIQAAVDAASAGDEIHIGNGTYSESVTVDVENLILAGESTSGVIISAGTSATGISVLANNVTIKNVTVNQNGDGISIDNVSGITIQDSIITNNTFTTSGIFIQDSADISITGNTITGNFIGIDLIGSASGVTATGNIFGSNTDYDIANNTTNNVTATGNTWDTSSGIFVPKILGQVTYDLTLPSVNAGPDKVVRAGFSQDASASDAYGISSYSWEKISGPGPVTFSNTAIEDPNISAGADGVYSIKLTVTDTSGNINSDTFQLTWDTVAPTGSWTTPASGETISGSTTLAAAASDSLSGVDSVKLQYKTNDGVDVFHNIAAATWDTTGLALDTYTLRAVITDKAGNSTTVDETVEVAAVVAGQSSSTTATNSFTIIWTTDRLTSGYVIYDTVSHAVLGAAPNYNYTSSTGTVDSSPKSTSHTIIITGLSANTQYFWRSVSFGSPTTVGPEYSSRTFSESSAGGGGGGGGGNPTVNTPPAVPPVPAAVLGLATEEVEEEILPTLTPSPSPTVQGARTSNFNWWLVIIPTALLGLIISGLLLWRRS